MTDDPRVQQLIDELFASPTTPEEVCQSCPELLPLVSNKWRRVRRLSADLLRREAEALIQRADKR
jgi:serine/threonine-protein kinase